MFIQKKWICSFIVVAATLLFSSQADSQTTGYQEISPPEAKMLQENHWNLVTINILSKLEFELQHIPESINIPFNKFHSTSLLSEDRTTPLIFYNMEVR